MLTLCSENENKNKNHKYMSKKQYISQGLH